MYSDPIPRATLVQQMPRPADTPIAGTEVRDYIRSQKAEGRLVERRVFVDPAHSRKRRQVFQFVATNLELDF